MNPPKTPHVFVFVFVLPGSLNQGEMSFEPAWVFNFGHPPKLRRRKNMFILPRAEGGLPTCPLDRSKETKRWGAELLRSYPGGPCAIPHQEPGSACLWRTAVAHDLQSCNKYLLTMCLNCSVVFFELALAFAPFLDAAIVSFSLAFNQQQKLSAKDRYMIGRERCWL